MDALANHLWQSTIVGLAAAALTWLLRNNKASVRFWIWFAASMKFAVPFALLSRAASALWPAPVMDDRAAAAVNVVFTSSALPPMSETLLAVSIGLWLLGTCLVLARWSREWKRVAAIVSGAAPLADEAVQRALERVERMVGVTPIPVVSSPDRMEPGVVGIYEPVLVWPSCLTYLGDREHIEPIIAHEMLHVVRRDNLLALMHMMVSAVFWFHPLVWWIGARLIDERERACDEGVLALGHQPASYARGILRTCELCVASPLTTAAGISGGELKNRIERIMRNEPAAPMSVVTKSAIVLVSVALIVMPIAASCGGSVYRDVPPPQDDSREVYRPGPDVKTPTLRKEVKPQYSARAMADKIEGEVLMECVVKADGTVGDIRITRSLDPDLDQAAVDAAKLWEFDPGTRHGKPVDVFVTIAMGFTLK